MHSVLHGVTRVAVSLSGSNRRSLRASRAARSTTARQGEEALYTWTTARRAASLSMMREFPDHRPARIRWPLFLVADDDESRRLQSSPTAPVVLPRRWTGRPETRRDLQGINAAGQLLAEARLKRDPSDVGALYFLGARRGSSAFAGAVERRVMAALDDGLESASIPQSPQWPRLPRRGTPSGYTTRRGLRWRSGCCQSRASAARERGIETLERARRQGGGPTTTQGCDASTSARSGNRTRSSSRATVGEIPAQLPL